MFGIGGFNPVSLLATTALGPFGGVASQLLMQVVSQVGQQFLQNLGQQAGLPQSDIDFAQADFTSQLGDVPGTARNANDAIEQLGQELGATPSDVGEAQRTFSEALQKMAGDAMQTDEVKESKGGGGWLRALARALGESCDKAASRLEQQAQGLDNASPSESAEYQADAQAFGMLMGAVNTAIKAIGEALNNMARKQ